jgi:hypothetical protein
MPRDEEDAAMRAQLALMELEGTEVDEVGKIKDLPYEAHRLRASGMSFKQIARRLGYSSEQAAHRAYTMYLQQAAVLLSNQQKEEALNLNITRLETLMHQHWNSALLGDVQSAGVVLKCISELNKIMGLYEVTTEKTTERYVVIQRETSQYADQLKSIALGTSEPKAISGHPDMID